jgi:NAD(P)-dependent dehydrogenase (short-subunit alcohol dehydrogenase family)
MELEGLEGRVALVTGAARGIGRQIATTLAAQGARVAGIDVQRPHNAGALALEGDVTDPEAVDATFREIERELGSVQVLVLNAGIFIVEPFEEISLEHWERTLAVNLSGAFFCARRALPTMREVGYGRLVAIGSSAGITGGASSCAAYAASKAGLMCLAKSIANEYAGTGVTANAVAPALIETAMMAQQPPDMASRVPIGRLGRPQDVADVVAFLCSAHADYITGAVIDVNGGFLVH